MTEARLTRVGDTVKIGRRYFAQYRCVCGALKQIDVSHVNTGHTRSCGCLGRDQLRARQTKHGRYYEPEHLAWRNMIKRCTDDRFKQWYGEVSVCDAWLASYDAFLRDVGRRPTPQHSLDRIDPKGNYEPSNVRWASKNVQSRNTKNHKTSTSGVRGVSWSAAKNKWRAAIYAANKQHHLGYFNTISEAKTARERAEQKLWELK